MAIHLHMSSRPGSADTAERLRALRDGVREQWKRIRTGFGIASPAIAGLDAMYRAELHDLHSAEQQLSALADEIWVTIRNGALAQRVSEYAAEVRSRAADSGNLLGEIGASALQHPDEAMHALVQGASRLAETCAEDVRDAALTAALQRIIHYMIADYGTLAAHARLLGRSSEAAHFAQHAARDRALDAELGALAESTVNPQTASAGESGTIGRQ